MVPASGRTSRASARNSVVLPLPFATDQRQQLARGEGKGQAIEYLAPAAAAGQVRDVEQSGRHRSPV